MAKTYWWISVGGNECEPAVRTDDGKLFTFGCPDPLDDTGIDLVRELCDSAPDTPAEAERKRVAWEKKAAKDAKRGIFHGYRRFG